MLLTISLVTEPGTESPKNTSAPFRASSKVLALVSTVWPDFHWFILDCLPLYMTPSLSTKITFLFCAPIALSNSTHAIDAAPAPLLTKVVSFIFLLVKWSAFIIPAAVTIAVPCWSSWKTGISIISLKRCSIIKQSGALISSKFIPPKLGPNNDTASTNLSISSVSTSKSIPSTSANFLNKTAFPSITGFDALAPILPKPNTAVPFEITATTLPLEV